ncbi:MAG: hypothetical protein WCL14_10240 [Bacteroidota bacterium]
MASRQVWKFVGWVSAKRLCLFAKTTLSAKSSFEATCHQSIAPIVAAARCLVSVLGMQRLQRIAGRTMIREETIGFKRKKASYSTFL